MPLIELQTEINARIKVCFDLARSIDLHKISTAKTKETAIDGITKGLINCNEFVTWQAIHFGIRQKLTIKITAYDRPFHFCDEQIKGVFKKMKHDHFFDTTKDKVVMTDKFLFESPYGLLGHVFNTFILTAYLKKFLVERNKIIKEFAESGKWKQLLV
jgi:ligand-binding SRPBCC domain-containing protein